MSVYSIRELERLSGVKAATIRIWEKRYDIVQPHRTSTNIRYYGDEDLRKLINLGVLNRKGYRISMLAALDDEELGSMALNQCLDSNKEDECCLLLTQAMFRVDEREFDRLFDRLERELGFDRAILHYILPFLQKVGVLWHSGAIDPAQEHFVSHLVRRKLMRAIEECEVPGDGEEIYLMFLPEGELHDICLLFSYYLARQRGKQVCYMGASVPMQDLEKIAQQYHYHKLLTAFINPIPEEELRKWVKLLLNHFPYSQLIITGPQANGNALVQNDRLHVIESVEAFRDRFLEEEG